MVVLTTESPTGFGFPSTVTGAAMNDCGNMNEENVALIFDLDINGLTVDQIADTAAFNIGVGLGLNVTTTPGDLMNSVVQDVPTAFLDSCSDVGTVACDDVPANGCAVGEQNSYRALLGALQ